MMNLLVAAVAAGVVHVGGMSESPYGTRTAETIVREGLGDYTVLFVGPWTAEKVRAVGDYCRANKMRFLMDETIDRLSGEMRRDSGWDVPAALAAARDYGDVLDGSLLLCEFGGLMFNWPESTVATAATKPPPATTFAEAASNTVACMRRTIADAEKMGVPRPYVCIEPTGGAAPFVIRAGIDRIDLEVIYGEDLERRYAGVVGATRAFGQPAFGVDMAMVWYGGNQHDALWETRWRTSLFHAFIRGANPIYAEHGLMNYQALGKDYDENHPDVLRFRRAVGDLARWAKGHPRPAGLPRAAMAAVQGRFDGFVGGWQTHLWGQRTNEAWRVTDADRAWELFDGLYRRRAWECREKWGDVDYSGNPPLGVADILPYDASDDAFARYKTLVFLGRNAMDDALYAKLVRFVRNGGTLLLAACHLGTANAPGAAFAPYNGGDWTELLGLRAKPGEETRMPYGLKFVANPPCGWNFPLWSANCDPKFTDGGFRMPVLEAAGAKTLAVASDRFVDRTFKPGMTPVLYSHALGKGTVVFLPSLDSPGAPGVRPLYSFLLASAAEGTSAWPKVECSDRVRWSVFGDEKLYLLNTEERLAQEAAVRLSPTAPEIRVTLAPGEIRELDLEAKAAPPVVAPRTTVKVDFSKKLGPVKPVNGVGQPPMLGAPMSFPMMPYLKEAGIPFSRLHDVGGTYGGMRYVDVPNVFRDFDADENDPANYSFVYTDALLKALVENGVEPFYRLGVTIDNAAQLPEFPGYFIDPPKDYAKWARICEHIIRHYTEGWADGFRWNIRYWEIWNEPENEVEPERNAMFRAPFSEYLRFYGVVAPYLKAKFPHLKIGGYGSCGFYAGVGAQHVAAANSSPRLQHFVTCAREFLGAAKKNGWPLDFFSFHSYSDPSEAIRQVRFADELLDEFGFTADRCERIFNEWLTHVAHENLGTALQAAGVATELIELQNGPCDVACLYDARVGAGMFAPLFNPLTYRPHKAYYAFTAFNELRKRGTAVAATATGAKGVVVAAADGGAAGAAVMVANDSDAEVPLAFDFGGRTVKEVRLTDATRTDARVSLPAALPPHAFCVILLGDPGRVPKMS